MLPMVLNAAMQLAGGDREPAPAPVTVPAVQGSPSRMDSRSAAMAGASRMVRALKPLPSRKPLAIPARGYEPPPEQEETDDEYAGDEEGGRGGGYGVNNYDDEEEYAAQDDGSSDEESYEDDGGGSDEMPDLNNLSAQEMKAAVINWIRADPSRKADVMGMLPDLSKEIT